MGCAHSKGGKEPLAATLAKRVAVVNYGVLGKRLSGAGAEEDGAPAPDGETLFVDPCSVRFVRDPSLCPGGAGGASGAIYKFIGIDGDRGFPDDVVAQIAKEGDVAYHRYGYPTSKHVLHCVGYDLRSYAARELGDLALSREVARGLLSALYASLLTLAAKLGKKRLRLVPISSGIFAGPLARDMPGVTAEALLDAVDAVCRESGPDVGIVRDYVEAVEGLELCVFKADECAVYAAAWRDARAKRSAREAK